MSNETLPLYFEKLHKFKPEFIEGFPSILLTLSRFLKKHNKYFPVKAVFTSSEPLYSLHREEIEDRFQTKIFDLYGQAERVSAATECPEHNGLHINSEYGILELLKENKEVNPGEKGKIIATGLNNFAMPLIRYETGDIAELSKKMCPCGRQMPLLNSVEGRNTDRIITPHGRIIPGGGIMGAFHGIANIKETQIIQEDINNMVIKIEKDERNESVNIDILKKNLQKCIGEDIVLNFDFVESLYDSSQAKKRWVISKIKFD